MESFSANLNDVSGNVTVTDITVDNDEILVAYVQDGNFKTKRFYFGYSTTGPNDVITIGSKL